MYEKHPGLSFFDTNSWGFNMHLEYGILRFGVPIYQKETIGKIIPGLEDCNPNSVYLAVKYVVIRSSNLEQVEELFALFAPRHCLGVPIGRGDL